VAAVVLLKTITGFSGAEGYFLPESWWKGRFRAGCLAQRVRKKADPATHSRTKSNADGPSGNGGAVQAPEQGF